MPAYHLLKQAGLPEVAELVPADGSLLVVLKPGARMPVRLLEVLDQLPAEATPSRPTREHLIRAAFDGPDLPAVADRLGLSPSTLIKGLCAIRFRVRFLGFQPGFAYLEGLPDDWRIPRLETPRKRVPAGSIALGGGYCGIYPASGPGGWNLIGRTDVRLFDPAASPPALLQPGDSVRLVAA